MDFLTQPSLIPTFAEEILHALLLHVDDKDNNKKDNKEAAKDLHLPLSYYQTVCPGISSPEIRDAYFTYLARLSITEAYTFARTQQPRNVRLHLLELLAASALSSSSLSATSVTATANDGHNGNNNRPARALELVDLPFDEEEEEELFANYLLYGKGKTLPGAKDTVMMRWIAKGDVQRVLGLGGSNQYHQHPGQPRLGGGRKHEGVNWDAVREGLERGLGVRKDVGRLYSGLI